MTKNKYIFLFLGAIFLNACNSTDTSREILSFNNEWKFNTGDKEFWSSSDFNDSTWKNISISKPWEEQEYFGYDGYAWYRTKIFIPSSLKKNAFLKDSLQFNLGIIKDNDQTFLNGVPLGSNNSSIELANHKFISKFETNIKTSGIFRKYKLATNDPRLLWDNENTIAIRVFNKEGLGGLLSKDISIRMLDIKDYIQFNPKATPYLKTDNQYIKEIFIRNFYPSGEFSGNFEVVVKSNQSQKIIYRNSDRICIPAKSEYKFLFSFYGESQQSYNVEYAFLIDHSNTTIIHTEDIPVQ